MQVDTAEQVRKADYPHYVMTLFAPLDKRPALFALYAFHLELTRIRHLVTSNPMGMIRLEWWREAIRKLYAGNVLRHETIAALAPHTNIWQENDFIALVDAYEADLEISQFYEESLLFQQADAIGTLLLKMASAVYGPETPNPLLKILGSCYYITDRLSKDMRCVNLNKKAIMNDVFSKINFVDKRKLKKSLPLLVYNFINWQGIALQHDRIPNDLMLSFYLWRKSFVC